MDLSEQLGSAVNDLQQWVEGRWGVWRTAGSRKLATLRPLQAVALLRREATHAASGAEPPGHRFDADVVLAPTGDLDDDTVLELIHRAGGRKARICVISGFEIGFAAAGRRQARQFARFGAERLTSTAVTTRVQAEDEVRAATVAEADLIVVTAGDALHTAAILQDTPISAAIVQAAERGAAVALLGGAAALAGGWVVGRAAGPAAAGPRADTGQRAARRESGGGAAWSAAASRLTRVATTTSMGAPTPVRGLGLLPDCVVDPGAMREGRLSALLEGAARCVPLPRWAVWLEPDATGLVGRGVLEAGGSGAVGLVDLRELSTGDAGRPVRTYLVPAGARFDLASCLYEAADTFAGANPPQRARSV